jgi:hypothetical protein
MVLSSSASVSVCSNTSFNLRVNADITGPQSVSVGTLLDQGAVGGQVIAVNRNITAPTKSGSYSLNVTAERYDPSGYALKDFSGSIQASAYDYEIVTSYDTHYYITTNYRGRITKVTTTGGYETPIEYITNVTLKDIYGNTMTVPEIGDEVVKSYSSTIPFEIGKPTVSVTKSSQAAIPSGTKDTVTWDSTYANKCICYNEAAYTTRCKNEAGSDVPSAKSGTFITGVLTSDKTYYFKCDNL